MIYFFLLFRFLVNLAEWVDEIICVRCSHFCMGQSKTYDSHIHEEKKEGWEWCAVTFEK